MSGTLRRPGAHPLDEQRPRLVFPNQSGIRALLVWAWIDAAGVPRSDHKTLPILGWAIDPGSHLWGEGYALGLPVLPDTVGDGTKLALLFDDGRVVLPFESEYDDILFAVADIVRSLHETLQAAPRETVL